MTDIKKYPNGLVLLKAPIPDSLSVIIGVFIQGGTREETKEQSGIAHFLEHMFFKGTNKYTSYELAKVMDDLGGQINAFTSHDFTCFYSHTLKEDGLTSLNLLKEMLFDSTFLETEIEKEKSVILEEMKMYEDDPSDLVLETMTEALFSGSPLEHRILGTPESIDAMTKDKLKEFFKTYYTPDKMVILIGGNPDMEDVENYVSSTFGQLKPSEKMIRKALIQEEKLKKFEFVPIPKADVSQVHFAFGALGVGKHHRDYYALELLSIILGGGSSSYLFLKIREELGLCYDLNCFQNGYYEIGQFAISGATSKEKFSEVLKALEEVLRKLSIEGISEEDFLRGRKQLLSHLILSNESVYSKVRLGNQWLYHNQTYTVQEQKEIIEGITLDDMNQCFKKYVRREAFGLCLVGPKGISSFEKEWRQIQW